MFFGGITDDTPKEGKEEPLLPIHRELTVKEKLDWKEKDYTSLERKYNTLLAEHKNLKVKNEKLNKRIEEDSLQYPSTMNGRTSVSVKAYFKLNERYKELDKRFWELVQELNQLKQEEKLK